MFTFIMAHRLTVVGLMLAFMLGLVVNDIATSGLQGFIKHIGLEK